MVVKLEPSEETRAVRAEVVMAEEEEPLPLIPPAPPMPVPEAEEAELVMELEPLMEPLEAVALGQEVPERAAETFRQ